MPFMVISSFYYYYYYYFIGVYSGTVIHWKIQWHFIESDQDYTDKKFVHLLKLIIIILVPNNFFISFSCFFV